MLLRVSGLCGKLIILLRRNKLTEFVGGRCWGKFRCTICLWHFSSYSRASFHSLPCRRSYWWAGVDREHFTRLLDGLPISFLIQKRQQTQTSKNLFFLDAFHLIYSPLRPYTDWLDFVLEQENPPLTISTSYGDDEQTGLFLGFYFAIERYSCDPLVPKDFAKRICAGFAQLGARGVSVMFSSGDYGVGDGDSDPATQECFTNDGRNITRFIPTFPAS